MFFDDDRGQINFKLVYLGPHPDLAARYVQAIHGRATPALRSELKLLRGDGQHVSAGTDVLVFDFTPALKDPNKRGVTSRLHLYALRGTPTAEDREFVLRGVDAALLVLDAASARDGAVLQALESDIASAQPHCVFVIADESGGAHDTTHPTWPVHAANIDTLAGVIDTVKLPTSALLEAVRSAPP
jgi:hypothetical protein